MPNEATTEQHETAGAWAKRFHLASRLAMESVLRPHGLGPTQWYVLYHLAHDGPTRQRELVRMLHVERATLTGVVAALVRKGLVIQTADTNDQRQKVLALTAAGSSLWRDLPDPIALLRGIAFAGIPATDLETTVRVLRTATQRLNDDLMEEGQA